MADPFVAEIRIFGFNFAPRGWAVCDGQLLPISQNTALFSLLGTYYGGDGKSTFALPDLKRRMAIQAGPTNAEPSLGEYGGAASVTLVAAEMPTHAHSMMASNGASQSSPAGAVPGSSPSRAYRSLAPDAAARADFVQAAGGGQPHNNLPPYLVMSFCIALQGIYPPRP
jgi:microcystin-dependent protein